MLKALRCDFCKENIRDTLYAIKKETTIGFCKECGSKKRFERKEFNFDTRLCFEKFMKKDGFDKLDEERGDTWKLEVMV